LSFDLRHISDIAVSTPGCLRADLGELNYQVDPMIKEFIKEVSREKSSFYYAPTFGNPELLEALQSFDSKYLDRFDKGKTLITAGGQAALFAVFHSLIRPGDKILTDRHYYPPYANLASLTGGELIQKDLSNLTEIEDSSIKMIIINSPNNPTGKVYDRETLSNLAKLAKKNDWIVLEDVVYDRIYFDNEPVSITSLCPERCLVINSASKNFCMPGIRIGWLSGPEDLIQNIAKLHRNMVSCPNAFFQKVLARFLPHSNDFFEALRKEMKERRDLILAMFHSLGWDYIKADGAIYAMATIPGLNNSISLVEKMIPGVKVSCMPGYYFGGHDDQLRFCFGALESLQIEELEKRLRKFKF